MRLCGAFPDSGWLKKHLANLVMPKKDTEGKSKDIAQPTKEKVVQPPKKKEWQAKEDEPKPYASKPNPT
ncbi:hypothetical protein Q3G72_013208 [Acer saccharum]|nr:hypothetical protein Q3G72_013208 [Acer saccharum]